MSDQPIIGIDLGTTNSLVAHFTSDGPVLIPNAVGSFLTPSAVSLDEKGQMLVGQAAKDRLVAFPDRSTARFKRFMGTDHVVQLAKQKFRAEDLSSFVLRALRTDAEMHLGQTINEAVISVPAYFNDVQRKATIAAAQLAGLQVKRLINEPTAAALAYGLHDRDGESTFLVIDLGGGTFDVSILEMFSGVMEVRSSAGDAFLGGEDFTDAIVALLADDLGLKVESLDNAERSRLRALADEAKHKLSEGPQAELRYVLRDEEKQLMITSARFEEATTGLLARMRNPIQRAISDAGLKADQLHRVILVGGATKMPLIRQMVTRLFKRFPEFQLNPDHVVALGAAVQAGLASRHEALEDVVMTDVSPFTMGIETSMRSSPNGPIQSGFFSPILERNTVIPASREDRFYNMEKGQKEIELNIFQGEAPMVKDNVRIGMLHVPIPYNMKEVEGVDVRFTYDTSGLLEVLATVVSTKKELRLIIEGNPGSMSRADIEKRLKELERIKVHPRAEAENQAIIARISKAYENSLGHRRDELTMLLREFEALLARQDPKAIVEARAHFSGILDQLEKNDVF